MSSSFDRLHLDRGVIRIDENPKYDFMPKAYQRRDIYIPPQLVEELRKLRPMAGCDLVFPTRNGTPNDQLLIMCKRIARMAGMKQDDWWLHRWRSTCATLSLREGMGRSRSAVWCPALRRCALGIRFRRWFGQSSCRSMLDAPATSILKFASIELKRPAYFVGMRRRVTR